MTKRKLGCDVDGVVLDFIGSMLPFANRRLGTNICYDQLSSFNPHECFGISRGEFDLLHDAFHAEEYEHDKSPIFEEAFEVLRELQEVFELHFITAPPAWVVEARKAYLPRHFPDCHVHFTNGAQTCVKQCSTRRSKFEIASELGLIAMIDDNPHEVDEWDHDSIPLIVHPQPWNISIVETHPHIPRLDWPQTKEFLLNLAVAV